jgi:16S rRNA (cytosine967-C5)-methyltransferase
LIRSVADPARAAAHAVLMRAEEGGHVEPLLHAVDGPFARLADRDRRFAAEIVFGVTRWRRSLDTLIAIASTRTPVDKIDPAIRTHLRMGLYQALVMDSVPERAAVHETVELAKTDRKTGRLSGFVNGVLRGALRATASIDGDLPEKIGALQGASLPSARRIGERYAYPDWLTTRWIARFGVDGAAAVAEAGNRRAPVFVRIDRPDWEEVAAEEGVLLTPVDLPPGAYRLAEGTLSPTGRLVTEGYAQPQDLSSQMAASLLDPPVGGVVADVCCGKGIKTGFFAKAVGPTGRVTAFDASADRLAQLVANMARLHVADRVTPVCADTAAEWPTDERFTHIYLDAPCSATGVIRRHPESKWNRTGKLVGQMSALQRRMAHRAAERLLPGGVLVYSVCSIEAEEGVGVIGDLLATMPELARIDVAVRRPAFAPYTTDAGDLFLTPGNDRDTDGFYAALITRAP